MNRGQREKHVSSELTTLMQVMRLNPTCWSQNSVETLLDDLEVLAAPEIPEAVLSRTQRVQKELILPLAEIVTTQSKAIIVERRRLSEREKKFKTALATLEAEKNKAIQLRQEEAAQLAKHTQFCDMLLGDLDEMAKTVDRTRLEKEQAEDKLAELEAEKERTEKRLVQLEVAVQRLTCEKEELIKQCFTYEPSGNNCKLERSQMFEPVSRNDPENCTPPASMSDQESHGKGTTATADEAVGTLSSLDIDNTPRDAYMLSRSDFQPHDYYSVESSYDNLSLLEQVAVVVLEEGSASLQMVLDLGLSSAPHAVQHFCKNLCHRSVIGMSAAILSMVKHSPLGFAFQMY